MFAPPDVVATGVLGDNPALKTVSAGPETRLDGEQETEQTWQTHA